jgi:hypothetical protein
MLCRIAQRLSQEFSDAAYLLAEADRNMSDDSILLSKREEHREASAKGLATAQLAFLDHACDTCLALAPPHLHVVPDWAVN